MTVFKTFQQHQYQIKIPTNRVFIKFGLMKHLEFLTLFGSFTIMGQESSFNRALFENLPKATDRTQQIRETLEFNIHSHQTLWLSKQPMNIKYQYKTGCRKGKRVGKI